MILLLSKFIILVLGWQMSEFFLKRTKALKDLCEGINANDVGLLRIGLLAFLEGPLKDRLASWFRVVRKCQLHMEYKI